MTNKNRILGFLYLIIVLIFVFYLPVLIGFVAGGFDTQAVINQQALYNGFAFLGLFFVCTAFVISEIIKKGDEKYGDSIFFSSPGEFPSSRFFKRFTNVQLFHITLIFTLILGLFANQVRNQSFTGIPIISQQFTETGSVLFTTFLVPAAEGIFFAGIIAFLIFGFRYLARKYNWSKENFRYISGTMIVFIAGLFGLALHLLRYGADEYALFVVLGFWLVGALLTVISGSFIPFWVLHITNNLLFDLKRFFSNDGITTIFIVIILSLIALYFVFWRKRLWGGKPVQQV